MGGRGARGRTGVFEGLTLVTDRKHPNKIHLETTHGISNNPKLTIEGHGGQTSTAMIPV